MKQSSSTTVRRLLGVEAGIGRAVGLDDLWAAGVIKAVGNYGEMSDRDLGPKSPLKMPRGPSSLWTQGGALHAWPIRLD